MFATSISNTRSCSFLFPVVLYQYLKYVANLSFTAKPDYEALRSLLRGSIRNAGLKNDGKLEIGERSGGGGSLKKVERSSDTENKRGGGFRDRISLPKSARKPCTPVQVGGNYSNQFLH